MFNWFKGRKALGATIAHLQGKLEEYRQVVQEQRKQITALQAANRVLKARVAVPKVKQSAPKPTIVRTLVKEPVRSITPAQSTKRAEDSGSDFLTGALTGLLVSEIFNDDSSRSSSSSCTPDSSSSSSSDSSPVSGGGGDFSGGGASGDY